MQNIIKIHAWAEPYVNFLLGETSPLVHYNVLSVEHITLKGFAVGLSHVDTAASVCDIGFITEFRVTRFFVTFAKCFKT